MSAFPEWLAQLRAARAGPVTLTASRGRLFRQVITIRSLYPGSTLRGEVRVRPDAAGSPIAEFTVDGPTIGDGTTTFVISLGPTALDEVAAAPGQDFVELAYDLLLTPDADGARLLFGGSFNLFGRITE